MDNIQQLEEQSKLEKQIEEMANVLLSDKVRRFGNIDNRQTANKVAECLLAEGYHKQNESEWEEYNNPNIMCCFHCGWSTSHKNPREFNYCPYCGAKMKRK